MFERDETERRSTLGELLRDKMNDGIIRRTDSTEVKFMTPHVVTLRTHIFDAIAALIDSGKKIAAIKLYRAETGADLRESKDCIDHIAANYRQL